MSKKIIASMLAVVLVCAVGCEKKDRPYSVLIVTASAFGNERAKGPTFDKLLKDGVVFENAFTPSPVTSSALTSLMTGLHPIAHNMIADQGFSLDGKAVTLGEVFQANGNRTSAFIGSTEIDMDAGLEQGFDAFDYKFQTVPAGPLPQSLVRRSSDVVKDAKSWVAAFGDKPFMLWAHFGDMEAGSNNPDETAKSIDSALGELIAAMPEKGRRTLIVFVSTSNEAAGAHGEHGHGLFLYDTTIHVPIIIAGPGVKSGKAQDVVSLEDLLPTVVSFLGMAVPKAVQGRDLSPILRGGKLGGAEPELVALTYTPYYSWGWSPLVSLRKGGMKYIRAPKPELYDLKADPSEANNLADQRADEVAKMEARLKELESRLKSTESFGVRTTAVPDPTGTLPDPKERFAAVGLIEQSSVALDENDFAKAVTLLEQANAIDPENRRVPYLQAKAFGGLGDTAKELIFLEEAARRMPGVAVVSAELGDAYMEAGNFEKAIKYLEDALTIDQRMPEVYLSLGYLYPKMAEASSPDVKLESMKKGLAYLIAAIKLGDDGAKTYFNIGALAMEIGMTLQLAELTSPQSGAPAVSDQYLKSATQAFAAALEKDKSLIEAHLALGRMLSRDPTQRAEAIKHLEAYLAASPSGPGSDEARTILKNLGR